MPEKSLEEIKLRRFLYTSNEECKYVAGNPEYYNYYEPQKLTSLQKLLTSPEECQQFINIIKEVNTECLIPRRNSLLFTLAIAGSSDTLQSHVFKHEIYRTILTVIRDDEELFLFIKYFTKIKKSFGSGLNKIINEYYSFKNPLELAKDVAKCKGGHGWTHKDIIKLTHCKSENILLKILFNYILFGMSKCKEIAENHENAKDLVNYLCKVEEFKKTTDENYAANLLHELQMPVNKIPGQFYKSAKVWDVAISNMTIQELIGSLTKFYKLGFLTQDSATHNKVVDKLSSGECIKLSKINAIEVFIGIKNFERGGKPRDPKLRSYINQLATDGKVKEDRPNEIPKCPKVMSALQNALNCSYQNLKPTGRRYLIAIDASTKMNEKCLHNRNITCYEAAAILVLNLLKWEKHVTVCCFTHQNLTQLVLDKNISIGYLIKKFKECEGEHRSYASMINWALNKKKQIDIFYVINYQMISSSRANKQKDAILQTMQKYQTTMEIQKIKVLKHSLGLYCSPVCEERANILHIFGFDKGIPYVLEGFARDLF